MLNYGAAAQVYFKYDQLNLANSCLTEEEKAYATESVTTVDKRVADENYYGSNLNLGSNIQLSMFFRNITPDMHAIVTFTDHYGHDKTVRIDGSKFKKHKENIYRIYIEEMVIADARQLITCTVYDAAENAVATATDSIESYVARGNTSEPLYEAIMKFADSAYAYFHS